MASLFKTMVFERITLGEARELLTLPRALGKDPSDGSEIIANNGRYGPYVQKGKDFRNITSEEQLLTISLEEAVAIFSQPKVFRRGGATNMAAKGPLKEFGNDPVSGKPVVAKDGKFGVYVTDGETNASLSKGDRLEAMEPERAYELLALRREAIIEKGGAPAKKAAATKKAAAKRATTATKAPAKKASAPKTAARKAAPRKKA
jgi:DNA topoisomerase-1